MKQPSSLFDICTYQIFRKLDCFKDVASKLPPVLFEHLLEMHWSVRNDVRPDSFPYWECYCMCVEVYGVTLDDYIKAWYRLGTEHDTSLCYPPH